MELLKRTVFALLFLPLMACGNGVQQQNELEVSDNNGNKVIETIMSRRSIRKYKPQPVNRDTLKTIIECGINAPNAMNRQAWAIRVVDNPEYINGVTEIFKKKNADRVASDPNFKNMFRNAPTVVFIANDTTFGFSPIDCGLLGENMILAAWSMGVGSCCLGGPTAFLLNDPDCADYLKRLDIPEGYQLLYCIAFGYPDEQPEAKPREADKIRFIE